MSKQQTGIEKALEAGKVKREKDKKEAEAHKVALTAEIRNANTGKNDEEIEALVKKQLDHEKLVKDVATARTKLDDLVIKLDKANSKGGSKTTKKVGEFANLDASEKTVIRNIRKAKEPEKAESEKAEEPESTESTS